MSITSKFKFLSKETKRLLFIGITLALFVALPLFIWAIVSQTFDLRKRAATGEPTVCTDEGQIRIANTDSPECCVGLTEIPNVQPPDCTELNYDTICTKCGNDICGLGENICNCPDDCPIQQPFVIVNLKMKFAGVSDDSANEALVTLRFRRESTPQTRSADYESIPFKMFHDKNGIYVTQIGIPTSYFDEISTGYIVYLKGEKHLSKKFCYPYGQTERCLGFAGNINIPSEGELNLDFTGMPIEPGDLPPQDGVVNVNDFQQINALMEKLSTNITEDDLKTTDLNYDNKINISDMFLLRQTLETKYDED
ncbi:MAG: hypothetical protein ABH812_02105 [bacterium]